jgi:hypothetical protein
MEKTEAEADVRESEENVLKQAALVAKLEEHGLLELAAQASEVLRYRKRPALTAARGD